MLFTSVRHLNSRALFQTLRVLLVELFFYLFTWFCHVSCNVSRHCRSSSVSLAAICTTIIYLCSVKVGRQNNQTPKR